MGNLVRGLRDGITKFFSSPSRAYPFYFMVAVVICLLYFFFHEVPHRQTEILDETFQDLATAGDQLASEIETAITIVEAQARRDNPKPDSEDKPAAAVEDLNDVAQTRKRYVECGNPHDGTEASNQGDPTKNDEATATTNGRKPQPADSGKPQAADEGTTVRLNSQHGKQVIRVEYHRGQKYRLCIDEPVDEVLDTLFKSIRQDLDAVALALGDGEVVYERAPGGYRLGNIGGLLESTYEPEQGSLAYLSRFFPHLSEQTSKTGKPGTSGGTDDRRFTPSPGQQAEWRKESYTALLDADLGGETYKLLVQPVGLPVTVLPEHLPGKESGYQLSIIGAVSDRRLSAEAHKVPLALATNFGAFVFLVLLMLWPVLKVWKMGPAEGVRRAEIVFFVYSLLAWVSLLTLFVTYTLCRNNTAETDKHLDSLATSIVNNVTDELSAQLTLLQVVSSPVNNVTDELTSKLTLLQVVSPPPSFAPAPSDEVCQQAAGGPDQNSLVGNILAPDASLGAPFKGFANRAREKYPWFDLLYWTDENGIQLVKWSTSKCPTRRTPVGQYPWFHAAKQGDLWSLNYDSANASRFLADTMYSPNTGEYLSFVVQPSGDENLPVGVLISLMISARNPILPPDYHFAIVNDEGLVLFHSDPARNRREQFFGRLRSPQDLRDAISRRSTRPLDGIYHSRRVRMLAMPFDRVANCPWTLVVYYDLEERDRFMIDALRYCAGCLAIYFLYLCLIGLAIWIGWHLRHPHRKKCEKQCSSAEEWEPWYALNQTKLGRLCKLAVGLLLFVVPYHYAFNSPQSQWLWILLALFPLLVLRFGWYVMSSPGVPFGKGESCGEAAGPWWKSRLWWTKLAVVSAAVAAVGGLAMLPTMVLFKLSFEEVRVPYQEDAQLELRRVLDLREHSITERLRLMKTLKGNWSDFKGDQDFEKERRNCSWDRYDTVWFNQSSWLSSEESPNENCGRTGKNDVAGNGSQASPADVVTRIKADAKPLNKDDCFPEESGIVCNFAGLVRFIVLGGPSDSEYVSFEDRTVTAQDRTATKSESCFWRWEVLSGELEPSGEPSLVLDARGYPLKFLEKNAVDPKEACAQNFKSGSEYASPFIVSELPSFPMRWSQVVVELAVGVVGLVVFAWFALLKRFGWSQEFTQAFPFAEDPKKGSNMLVLTLPWVQYPYDLKAIADTVQEYDLAELLQAGFWRLDTMLDVKPIKPIVLVGKLEVGIQDPNLNDQTLNLIEYLLDKTNKTIILVSAVEPVSFLFEDFEFDPEAHRNRERLAKYTRWINALQRFELKRANPSAHKALTVLSKPSTEEPPAVPAAPNANGVPSDTATANANDSLSNTAPPNTDAPFHDLTQPNAGEPAASSATTNAEKPCSDLATPSQNQARIDKDHHELWMACTRREKLVLWQLASDGTSNPKNHLALEHLIQRGIVICRDMLYRISDSGFSGYVCCKVCRKGTVCQKEIDALFPPDEETAWRSLRWVMVYAIVGIGVIFLLSYAQLLEGSALRFVTIGGTAAVPLVKMAIDMFSRPKSKTGIDA